MEKKFKIGEQVALSTAPYQALGIAKINEDGTYKCTWMVNWEIKGANLEEALLIPYKEPEPMNLSVPRRKSPFRNIH